LLKRDRKDALDLLKDVDLLKDDDLRMDLLKDGCLSIDLDL